MFILVFNVYYKNKFETKNTFDRLPITYIDERLTIYPDPLNAFLKMKVQLLNNPDE